MPHKQKLENIKSKKLSIYDSIEIGDPNLWLSSIEISNLLNESLVGDDSLKNLPLRTRSKIAKSIVCSSLGFEIPVTFKKTQPRFPCLNFDIYVQKSNNLQIWNEELDPQRRYILIKINDNDIITKIKVLSGSELSKLDTTGTLTQKYQARLTISDSKFELISKLDTEKILSKVIPESIDLSPYSPIDNPTEETILPIRNIFESLKKIVGSTFFDSGHDQERNRGAILHQVVCHALGYKKYADNGQFPDIRHQLLEIKLQTSPTIDLGLVCPDSNILLDIEKLNGLSIAHSDVRYAIFYASKYQDIITIENLFLTTGRDFFSRFTRFEGKVLNKKLQIPLPQSIFF